MKTRLSIVLLILVKLFIILNSYANAGFFGGSSIDNEGLYKLLNVAKTATTKEIRVAFKKLALEKHPDKNQDDPNANDLFIKINRAYEILKDEELRKKYDQYGEEGLKDDQNKGNQYQSWNFYKQNFGIYDEDPEVVTLTRSDFKQFVESNENTIWFINFYSTQCSHCHELAPTWRELAKQLDGVVKIGAVNCMDDWMLCNEQQIQAFPSLIMYPKRQRFSDAKTFDNLFKFALSFASGNVYDLSSTEKYTKQLAKNVEKPWLISYCLSNQNLDDESQQEELNYELNCLDEVILRKLAIMLHGLVRVGFINCNKKDARENLCPLLKPKASSPLIFYSNSLPNITKKLESSNSESVNKKFEIVTSQYKLIVEAVLSYLPDLREIDEAEFNLVLERLRDKSKSEKPWLIQFVNANEKNNHELDLKKLPVLLSPNFNFAKFDCSKQNNPVNLCNKYQIVKYPTFAVFKSSSYLSEASLEETKGENWYEIYYGNRQAPEDLAQFVSENANTRVRTLTDFSAESLVEELNANGKQGYFVDFFAPWCPPCMNLLPEFRKASKLDASKSILFGTIDCTTNPNLCEKFGVRSYPTTMLFNHSTPHTYLGHHSAQDIADFIQDILKPSVITLNYDSFYKLVGEKTVGKIWLVDFYASWCGPCQQLAPEWRKLAKKVDQKIVSVGQVDCVIEQRLCNEQGIQSYPNIRLYPSDSARLDRYDQYQGWMRDSNSLLQWVQNYMPSISVKLDMNTFEKLILKNEKSDERKPWMVDFYAPWCGHCQVFSPVFESLASKFQGLVNFGKVNCDENQYLCQMAGIRAYPTIKFFQIFKSSNQGSWNSGEDIEQYDFNSLFNTIHQKLKRYGYNNDLNNRHTEL